jgi:hypothetical protein
LTPPQRRLLDALDAAQTPTVGSLFDIAQGVQTGNLKIFLLDDDAFRRLNPKEKPYFRDALMTDSIESGRIVKQYHLFFPHRRNGPLFADEAALAAAVPIYYATVLKPNEEALKARASIVRAKRADWWGLMHPRAGTFAFDDHPRIVSKFFGAEGSFALDAEARYLPSTGHVWTPKQNLLSIQPIGDQDVAEEMSEDVSEEASLDVMRAYVALLNSRAFVRLVSFRSVTIAGGQFDLSSRFLSAVFLPNLWEKAEDSIFGGHVQRLASVTMAAERGDRVHAGAVDRLVADLYGVPEFVES